MSVAGFNGKLEEEVVESVAERRIALVDVDLYKSAIVGFKNQIAQLVQEGVMSEQTATRLTIESEYSFFQQIVKIEYK